MKVLRGILVLTLLFGMQMQGYSYFSSLYDYVRSKPAKPDDQLPENLFEKDEQASLHRKDDLVVHRDETPVVAQHQEGQQGESTSQGPQRKVSLGETIVARKTKAGDFFSSQSKRRSTGNPLYSRLDSTFNRDNQRLQDDLVGIDEQQQNKAVDRFQRSRDQLARGGQPIFQGGSFRSYLETAGLSREATPLVVDFNQSVALAFRSPDVWVQIPGARRGETYQVSSEAIGRFLASGKINESLFATFARDRLKAEALSQVSRSKSVLGIFDFYKRISETRRIPANAVPLVEQIVDDVVKESQSLPRSLAVVDEDDGVVPSELGNISVPLKVEDENPDDLVVPSKTLTGAKEPELSAVQKEQAGLKPELSKLLNESLPAWLEMMQEESDQSYVSIDADPMVSGTQSAQVPVEIDEKKSADTSVPEWLAHIMQDDEDDKEKTQEPEKQDVATPVNALKAKAADVLKALPDAEKAVIDLTKSLTEKAPEVVKDLKNTLGAILKSKDISKAMKDKLAQVTFKQKVSILLGLALANAIVLGIVEATDKKDIDDALAGLLVIDAVVATGLFAPEEGAGKGAQKNSMPALLQSKKPEETSKQGVQKAIAPSGASKK